ncbi:hypothetical protein I6M44_06740 [Shewanella algae]|uniref:hypothetical protein n=1 Tax=Shewanella algae TaxID=38313 RepID=UPI001AAD4B64|nr:hypothetical protein [Shewanella algae]MBO2623783.1 hypothetical protein [Shewanella algae]
MNSQISQGFEIATWYDTWNPVGLNNLVNNLVPLHLASRYSLAFGQLSAIHSGGYCIEMSGKYADAIKDQLLSQAPGIELYAGIGSEGIQASVASNKSDNNLSTRNIVSWLKDNHYTGINIDAEEREAMKQVAEFVTQLGPEFRAAGLGIAVSVPWPGKGRVTSTEREQSRPLTIMSMRWKCRTTPPSIPPAMLRFGSMPV